ncbi:substrate-binding domain-containing protein [Paenibacillus farraposensis]|uniref:Substrate-binding domain-containing protein n=1 Tax=Paenibacillus farraposensis TaxID=2807095 RepID=A0ABW4DA70_9BACL|nr:substrate-binding domain-containing protein [Paenibacillus farraposensis]
MVGRNIHRTWSAIIATNDMILEQVLMYAKNNRLTIPHDFSLISIDDVSSAAFYNPPITTVFCLCLREINFS